MPKAWPAIVGASAAIVVSSASPAAAQGFFQSLFGIGNKKPAAQPRQKNRRTNFGNSGINSQQLTWPYILPLNRNTPQKRPRRTKRAAGGGYRTMCVRSCDGFYFPISNSVSRSRFGKDENICRAKCSGEARLYYMPRNSAPDKMIDRRGRAYAKTKTAFLFRRKQVTGCGCRPQAWAPSEAYRHKMYELNEPIERKLARQEGDVEFLAGITKVRKSVRLATKVALAAKAARQKEMRETARLAGLQKMNEARALGRADDRIALALINRNKSRRKSARVEFVFAPRSKPVAEARLGQPSNYANYYANANDPNYGERVKRRRRRFRVSYDDGSYRYVKVRSGRRRNYRTNKRSKKFWFKNPSGWGFGGKPKYRWPGD